MRGHKDTQQVVHNLAPTQSPQQGAGHPRVAASGRSTIPPPPLKWPDTTPTAQPQMAGTYPTSRQAMPVLPLRMPPAARSLQRHRESNGPQGQGADENPPGRMSITPGTPQHRSRAAGVQRLAAAAPPPVRMPPSSTMPGARPPEVHGGRALPHAHASTHQTRSASDHSHTPPATEAVGAARTSTARRPSEPGHAPDGAAQARHAGTAPRVVAGGRAARDELDQGRRGQHAPTRGGAIQPAKKQGGSKQPDKQAEYKKRQAAQEAQKAKAEAKRREEANAKKVAMEQEIKAATARDEKAKAEKAKKAELEKEKAAVESVFRRHEDIARFLETPANVCVAIVQDTTGGLLAAANQGNIGTFGWVHGTLTVSQAVAFESAEGSMASTARKLDAYLHSTAPLAQAVGAIQQVGTTESHLVHAEMKLLNYIDQHRQQFPGQQVELYISRLCCANCSAAIDIWNKWKSPKVTVRKGSSASRWPGWQKPAWMTQHPQANPAYDSWEQQWQQANQGFTAVTGLPTRRPRSDSNPISAGQTTMVHV